MDSQSSDLGLMPSDEYPAWTPEPDAPKTVYALGFDLDQITVNKIQAGSICVGRMHVDPETGKWTEFTPEEYAAEDARLRELSHYKTYVRPVTRDSLIEGNK